MIPAPGRPRPHHAPPGPGGSDAARPAAGRMPEVAEVEASGDTLRIYGELRAIGGYELVPLFYRVLATDPAALCWAWHVLRPAFRSGVVAAAARAAVPPPGRAFARLPAPGWTLLGMSAQDVAEARAVVAGFNAANPFNLTVVLLLEQALRDGRMIDGADPSLAGERLPHPGIPHRPPLDFDALPAAQADLIAWLSTRGRREAFAAAPTLWRCLAHWPPLLAVAAAQLEPLYADGTVEALSRSIRRAVEKDLRERAEVIGSRSVAAAEPSQADHVLRVCAFFGAKIPEMILTGHLLQALMEQAEG